MVVKVLRHVASSGKSSPHGTIRYEIYKSVWKQVAKAKEAGCWLEVVTLAESIIADRLEARRAHLARQAPEGRVTKTAAQTAHDLLNGPDAKIEDVRALLEQVRTWSKGRNSVIHELAKFTESTSGEWASRYDQARHVALEGEKLARQISGVVKRLNSPAKAVE